MLYKLTAAVLMLSVLVSTPDYDDFMNQDCGRWDECE